MIRRHLVIESSDAPACQQVIHMRGPIHSFPAEVRASPKIRSNLPRSRVRGPPEVSHHADRERTDDPRAQLGQLDRARAAARTCRRDGKDRRSSSSEGLSGICDRPALAMRSGMVAGSRRLNHNLKRTSIRVPLLPSISALPPIALASVRTRRRPSASSRNVAANPTPSSAMVSVAVSRSW